MGQRCYLRAVARLARRSRLIDFVEASTSSKKSLKLSSELELVLKIERLPN
jgi:hypothetical protein